MKTVAPQSSLGDLPVVARRGGGFRAPFALGMVVAVASAAFIGGMGATASAAPGDTSADSTTANVGVSSSITLGSLTPTFTLDGLPGATVTGNAAVTFNVLTNNAAGYTVTVQSATDTLLPAVVANPDSIPIADLGVRESAAGNTGAFTAMSSAAALTVHDQAVRSAVAGDDISDDYQIAIPFVASDTYSATLNYIATAS